MARTALALDTAGRRWSLIAGTGGHEIEVDVRWRARGVGVQELGESLVGAHVFTSVASSPDRAGWDRSAVIARELWLLTVPTEQPSAAAVCASVRSEK